MYITKLTYDTNISSSVEMNNNKFIIDDNIIVPCIKEKIDNYNEIIDTEIVILPQNEVILGLENQQIITSSLINE